MLGALFVLLYASLVAGTDCESCVSGGGGYLWCYAPNQVMPSGSFGAVCAKASAIGNSDLVGCVNSTKHCLCATLLGGCSSCLNSAQCHWVGKDRHRGIGFCALANASLPSFGRYLRVVKCPIPGMETWATFAIAIGGGIVLSSLVALTAWCKERSHRGKQGRLVSSLLSQVGQAEDFQSDLE